MANKENDIMTTSGHQSCQQHDILLGSIQVHIDDNDFVYGFEEGYDTFHAYHSKEERIDASIFLFLLKNGWGVGHSEMWTTGYILGWLAACYEQERGQLALSSGVSSVPCHEDMRAS